MSSQRTYFPFYIATALLCCMVWACYSHLQYYIDPDATAYLTIAKRYASGDYNRAINGYWSPWSCWVTALFIKIGLPVISASIVANTIGAVGVLFVTHLFFLKYRVNEVSQWWLYTALAVFLTYAVYYQNFDDLWECFFLLYALRTIVSHRFRYTPRLWVQAGVLGALGYFAKAYAFPFFIVSSVCLAFYVTRAWHRKYLKQWLLCSVVMIATLVLVSFPWLYALRHKYGFWTTATAGTLNMSWYLVGHPYWKEGVTYLLPPVFPDSPTYWEDPWFVNGVRPQFWHSPALFGRQLLKIAHNSLKFTVSSMQISVAFLLVLGYIIRVLLKNARRQKYRSYYPVIIPFMLFPLPFFLINFEPRYIWYMLPLSMLLGALILQKEKLQGKKWIIALFAISYAIYPVKGIYKMWDEGKAEYILARQLTNAGIKGSFASNVVYGMPEAVAMQRLAYLSGSAYYMRTESNADINKLLVEARRYRINYFIHGAVNDKPEVLKDEQSNQTPIVFESKNIRIYRLTPDKP